MKNKHAAALGRLGKGRKKTMTPEAMLQRREAAKKSVEARKKTLAKRNESVSG